MVLDSVKSVKVGEVINIRKSDTDDDEDYDEGSTITKVAVDTTSVTRSRACIQSLTSNATIKRRQKLIEKSINVNGEVDVHGWTIFTNMWKKPHAPSILRTKTRKLNDFNREDYALCDDINRLMVPFHIFSLVVEMNAIDYTKYFPRFLE